MTAFGALALLAACGSASVVENGAAAHAGHHGAHARSRSGIKGWLVDGSQRDTIKIIHLDNQGP
ncbi:hypothetical protein ASE59_05505 [Sphingomonas sp. Leaf10]|nr:hypothetical protein ASE59_05505 [Sphingomonas sp. Leaf10]